jgi:uncharacterized protein YecE (DUF72 family)
MKRIYAGTSGWAYSTWKPKFYPAKLASKAFLAYYATQLNSVEVNYTFRRHLNPSTLNSWINASSANFQFAVKAHQSITHIKRLRDAEASTGEFLKSLQPLREAKKLGPVLFQLPPNFKCDIDRLRNFLPILPKGWRFAFEFRHESWFNEEIYSVLRKTGVAMCLAESEKIETPEIQTAKFHYVRFRKPDHGAENEVNKAAQKVRRLVQTGDVYAYFKHEDDPAGALNAVSLRKRFK